MPFLVKSTNTTRNPIHRMWLVEVDVDQNFIERLKTFIPYCDELMLIKKKTKCIMNNGNKRILQVYYHKEEICPADSCNGTVKTAGFLFDNILSTIYNIYPKFSVVLFLTSCWFPWLKFPPRLSTPHYISTFSFDDTFRKIILRH